MPSEMRHVARIGKLIIAGQREYCGPSKILPCSLELGFVPNNQIDVTLITQICGTDPIVWHQAIRL